MAQRYRYPIPLERMAKGLCPECGTPAETHIDGGHFITPRICDLLPHGVTDRIEQYKADLQDPPEPS